MGYHCLLHKVPRGEEHRYRLWTQKGIKREKLKTKNRHKRKTEVLYTLGNMGECVKPQRGILTVEEE